MDLSVDKVIVFLSNKYFITSSKVAFFAKSKSEVSSTSTIGLISFSFKSASTDTKEFAIYQDDITSQDTSKFADLLKSKTSILKYHKTYHNKDKNNTTKNNLDSHTLKGLNLNNEQNIAKTKNETNVARNICKNTSIVGIQNQAKNPHKTATMKNQK